MAAKALFPFMPGGDNQLLEEDLYSDDDNEEGSASIYEVQLPASPKSQLSPSTTHTPFLHFSSWVYNLYIAPRDKIARCKEYTYLKCLQRVVFLYLCFFERACGISSHCWLQL